MKKDYLHELWTHAPLSWAIIRAVEVTLLSKQKFTRPILEVGCGDGFVSKLLFKSKKNSIDMGIDLDKNELYLASKTRIYKQLRLIDITQTPFRGSSYATVFANGVLEHIPRLDLALSEVSRILKKNGYLITTSPTNNYTRLLLYYRLLSSIGLVTWAKRYEKFINLKFAHRHLIDISEWEKYFKSAGLRLVYYKYYNNKFVTTLHDLSLPFALGTKQLKLKTGKMALFTKMRRLLLHYPSQLFTPHLKSKTSDFSKNSSILLVAQKI